MRTVGIVLLSIVFFFVALFTLLLLNVNQTFLKASFYKDVLNETNAYSRLLDTEPKFFVNLFSTEGDEAEEAVFSNDEVANIIKSIKPDTLRQVVEPAIDVMLNDTSETSLSINLVGIKSDISSGEGEMVKLFSEIIPDDYELIQGTGIEGQKKILSVLPVSIIILTLISVVTLFLIGLLGKSWASRLKTIGIVLFITSLPILAVAVLGLYIIPIKFEIYPEVAGLIVEIIAKTRDGFLFWFLAEAIIIAMIALVLYIFSIIISRKDNGKEASEVEVDKNELKK